MPPRVSIIIPSRDGFRDGYVPKLLASIEAQTFRDFDVQLIKGVFPQGKAINEGVRRSAGAYVLVIDDDSRLADESVLARIIETLDADARIGMAGASIVSPPEASAFQKRAARQFPRFSMPVVDRVTDSDFACHGCCAFPRAVFEAVGGEREDIIRGLDPDLRERIRHAGYRVVLVPGAVAFHPLPAGWGDLLRLFFRNGFGSAYAHKYQPDSVYDTHENVDAGSFRARRSLTYRLARYPLRLIRAAFTGRTLRLAGYCSYACGYVWGALTARENAVASGR
jgi:GT2 family glycosyltransferase